MTLTGSATHGVYHRRYPTGTGDNTSKLAKGTVITCTEPVMAVVDDASNDDETNIITISGNTAPKSPAHQLNR